MTLGCGTVPKTNATLIFCARTSRAWCAGASAQCHLICPSPSQALPGTELPRGSASFETPELSAFFPEIFDSARYARRSLAAVRSTAEPWNEALAEILSDIGRFRLSHPTKNTYAIHGETALYLLSLKVGVAQDHGELSLALRAPDSAPKRKVKPKE